MAQLKRWGGTSDSGTWFWVRRPQTRDSEVVVGKVSYGGSAYLDDGFGVNGWVPVKGVFYVDPAWDGASDDDNVSQLVWREVDFDLEEMVTDGSVCKHLPGYGGCDGC